jgi:hypothetical protein
MAKVRLLAPEERLVPWIDRIVQPDEVVTIPDEHVESYTCQPAVWELVESTTEAKASKRPAPRAEKDGE